MGDFGFGNFDFTKALDSSGLNQMASEFNKMADAFSLDALQDENAKTEDGDAIASNTAAAIAAKGSEQELNEKTSSVVVNKGSTSSSKESMNKGPASKEGAGRSKRGGKRSPQNQNSSNAYDNNTAAANVNSKTQGKIKDNNKEKDSLLKKVEELSKAVEEKDKSLQVKDEKNAELIEKLRLASKLISNMKEENEKLKSELSSSNKKSDNTANTTPVSRSAQNDITTEGGIDNQLTQKGKEIQTIHRDIEEQLRIKEEEKTTLSEKITELEGIRETLSREVSEKTTVIDNINNEKSIMEATLKKVQDDNTTKEEKIQILKEKMTELSDKMKSLMKRYTESKNRVQQLENIETENASEIKTAMANKDGELVSLKLKLQHFENTTADQEANVEELTRINTFLKNKSESDDGKIKDLDKKVTELEKELTQAVEATSGLAEEASSTQKLLAQEKKRYEEAETESTKRINELKEKIEITKVEHDRILHSKQVEYENLKAQISEDNKSAEAFDEYKKRAQTALKKANSSSSTMTSEINTLKESVEEKEKYIVHLQQELDDLSKRYANEVDGFKDVKSLSEILKSKSEELEKINGELKSKTEEKDKLIHQLNIDVEKGERKCEKLESEVQDAMKKLADRTSSTTESFVNTISDVSTTNAQSANAEKQEIATNEQIDAHQLSESKGANESNEKLAEYKPPKQSQDLVEKLYNRGDRQTSSDQLYYVHSLSEQLETLKRINSDTTIDLEETRRLLRVSKNENKTLGSKVEELLTFLDRTKRAQDPDAAINMEYLKNCVYRFMASTEHSERQQLSGVIATILKLTVKERRMVELALNHYDYDAETIDHVTSNVTSTLGAIQSLFTTSS